MSDDFHWQGLLQRCSEPLFILNRQRRILFVNTAWEQLTGCSLTQVRGWACRRRRKSDEASPDDALLSALSPPPDALEGRSVTARRLRPGRSQPGQYWEIAFLPLRGSEGLLAILGKIRPLSSATGAAALLLTDRLLTLRDRVAHQHQLDWLDTTAPAGWRLNAQVRLASQTHAPTLLRGEPGTGKHWTARVIHFQGPTADRPFITLDCRRLPAPVLDRALFGPGGWTEPGQAGTVYLKEPQHLPREVQGKLVGWLAASEAEVAGGPLPRLLAGCSAEPGTEVEAGRLLADLHCALSVFVIPLPLLRERQAEFVPLAERFLARAAACTGRAVTGLTLAAWDVLRTAQWPGNLTELYVVLRAACLRAPGDRIGVEALPFYLRSAGTPVPPVLNLKDILHEVERRLISLALAQSQDNKARAAEMLSVWRAYLLRRISRLKVEDREQS